MHKFCLLLFILYRCVGVQAQYKITFRIKGLPAYHNPADPIYIAGGFNNWNPAQRESSLQKDPSGIYSITLDLAKGVNEYKFTRGSWANVESGEGGIALNNRVVEANNDTIIEISIQHWADHFAKQPLQSTASKNVKIIERSFFIPQLNRSRRIWIYLPDGYASSGKKYPVLYMHDGQNVFEDSTSFSGEWGVDEALDTLGKKQVEIIVVAIDHGGDERLNEYSPFDAARFGKGEGDLYVDFLVKTLRPYINKNYRTKRCFRHNYIAGSSMGGLISYYALLKYPNKWGGAGVFSPAFWIVPQLKNVTDQKAKKIKRKIYFYAGQQEGPEMVPDMLGVLKQLSRLSKAKMTTVIRAEGKHNEATWRNEFPLFYKWMFGQ